MLPNIITLAGVKDYLPWEESKTLPQDKKPIKDITNDSIW